MAKKKELEELIKDLIPIINALEELKAKYPELLKEYKFGRRILTEEERNEAAIEMINKYSNL